MKIAVTGAAGHLGSNVCGMLADEGMNDIICIDVKEMCFDKGEKRKADLSRIDDAKYALQAPTQ